MAKLPSGYVLKDFVFITACGIRLSQATKVFSMIGKHSTKAMPCFVFETRNTVPWIVVNSATAAEPGFDLISIVNTLPFQAIC